MATFCSPPSIAYAHTPGIPTTIHPCEHVTADLLAFPLSANSTCNCIQTLPYVELRECEEPLDKWDGRKSTQRTISRSNQSLARHPGFDCTVDNGVSIREQRRFQSGRNHASSIITRKFKTGYELQYGDHGVDLQMLCKQGRLKEAMRVLDIMDQRGIKATSDIYVCLLKGCMNAKALTMGKRIHAHIVKYGVQLEPFLGNTLANMYIKCGRVADASRVFADMPERNVYTWTIMIGGYSQHGQGEEALELFGQMEREGFKPNEVTYASILKACASITALEQGKQIHASIMRNGFQSDVFVGSILVDMYAKCGCIELARLAFDNMPKRDTVSWTAMIAGYAQHGQGEKALELFQQMEQQGVKPNKVTFVSILKACASIAALDEGKQIHARIIKEGFGSDAFVGNTLVDMYAKCGSIENAREVFNKMHRRDVVTWNAMIAGYVQHGDYMEAFNVFLQMERGGINPDEVTFASILKACTSEAFLEQGKQIHARIMNKGFDSDAFVGSSLVDMYAKCGCIEHARQVFDGIPKRGVVAWTAMIAAYANNGQGKEALELFERMQEEGKKPNEVTLVSILKACANVAALEQGKQIHAYIIKNGFDLDVFVGSALIDMYAKCGSIEYARSVFDKMPQRGVISWTAMIAGYAHHGHANEALQLVKQMQLEDKKPDHITFIGILSACNHAGLVNEGYSYFYSMSQDHGIIPSEKHYASMVDLLGRAGCLDEAGSFIQKMPSQPSAVVWTALLGACRIHGNMEVAKHAAECILELEPQNAAALVLLSNIYAAVGQRDEKARVRNNMHYKGVKKKPGCSHIEVNNRVHRFVVEDKTHPQIKEIHAELKRLLVQMEQAGYVPDTRFVLHDVEEEQKELSLCHHSEKLAITFGLISTSQDRPIRVVKSLRICGDCHTAAKFISKIVRREIIMRDDTHFHRFKDGVCSCSDYY